ncbi:DUF1674-domain-containing protein [Nemania sp. NC0429]|nr:DUF1674-domain-containing protein [Nemania sp. NC0429]
MATRITRFIARPVSHLSLSPAMSVSTSASAIRPLRLRHSSTSTSTSTSPFPTGPSPPRLPPHEQAEFERLQRTASTQEGSAAASSSTDTTSAAALDRRGASSSAAEEEDIEPAPTPLRKGAPPEFEGDVNPRTGEVGGPKNEPLRWGPGGDYSFNGRVTDF